MTQLAKSLAIVLIALFSLTSFAAFSPVSSITYTVHMQNGSNFVGSSHASACAAAFTWFHSVNPGVISVTQSDPICALASSSNPQAYTGSYTEASVQACPSNSTGTASCTCNSGFIQNPANNGCTDIASAIAAIVSGLNLVGAPYVGTGGGLQFCYGGFPIKASGAAYNPANPTGTTNYFGPYSSGSGDCSTAAQATSPVGAAACKSNQYFGQVNGVDTCVNGASVSTSTTSVAPAAPSSAASSAAPSLGSNAPAGATQSTTTTTCVGSACTVTTDYKNGSGVVLGSSTTSAPVDPALDDCAKNPNAIGCASFGTPEGAGVIPSVNSGFTGIVPVSFTSSAVCPSPLSINAMGKDISFSYAGACDAITAYLAPILLLLSAGLAAWIFVGGFKS